MLKAMTGSWLMIIALQCFADTPPMITHTHHPEAFIRSIQNDPLAGQKVYQQFCSVCHDKNPSIHLGAPRKGMKADWKLRQRKGLNGLLAVTITGLNEMPPRGSCFECNDQELKAAIAYMLPPSKPTH